jgi:integrase
VAPVEHHAALPFSDVGAFFAELRQQKGVAARALEFLILTWGRTGEVIGCRWAEIDTVERLWVLPPERMKANREHRVPLSRRAIDIIGEMQEIRSRRPSEYVFPGNKVDEPLSNMSLLMTLRRMGHNHLTCHGFRATAKTWASPTRWSNWRSRTKWATKPRRHIGAEACLKSGGEWPRPGRGTATRRPRSAETCSRSRQRDAARQAYQGI